MHQVQRSRLYRPFLASIRLRFLEPYARKQVGQQNRFFYAEVQLATFHRRCKTHLNPRTIGTSKDAYYLCNLFLSHHLEYNISTTHGMLYEFWTIPDLASYVEEDKENLRNIIRLNVSTADWLDCRKGLPMWSTFCLKRYLAASACDNSYSDGIEYSDKHWERKHPCGSESPLGEGPPTQEPDDSNSASTASSKMTSFTKGRFGETKISWIHLTSSDSLVKGLLALDFHFPIHAIDPGQ